jgi:flavin-binding protein dodecin
MDGSCGDCKAGPECRGGPSQSRERAATRPGPSAFVQAGCGTDARPEGRTRMEEHVYKVIDLVGSSETSIEDAIQTAVARASRTMRNLRWFEVGQIRGHIQDGKVRHYQVVLKVGFTLEEG